MRLEHWLYTVPLRLRTLLQRRRVELELDEEMRFHLEQRTKENIAKGLTSEEARHEALRAMHGLEQRKEECRDARRLNPLENFGRDLRYALRMMRKSPAFTAVAILSLALGIGANTAIFSLIDTLLLRPLPVSHPEQLRSVFASMDGGRPRFYLTYPMFEALRSRNEIFSTMFTWASHRFQMRSGPDMAHVDGMLASGDYFTSLGVSPVIGRTFTGADDHPSGGKDGPVAVISDRFWARQFQRNPAAIGSALMLDDIRFTVIGVMPSGFFGAEVASRPDIWVPLALDGRIDGPACMNSRSCWWLIFMGRLKPGISDEQAQAALKVISPQIFRDTLPPGWDSGGKQKYLRSQFFTSPGARGWSFLRIQFSNPLAILMTLVALVLLIACANMANLLLARGSARHREIAVRLAIGAGRGRIVRQLLTESTLLSLLGGAAGTLLAFWLTRLLIAFLESKQQAGPGLSVQIDLHPDWRVIVFTFVIAAGSGLLFGLAPALRATRTGIGAALKERAHNLRSGEGRLGIGRITLMLQATLSVLLVAVAGLFAGSLFHLLTLNPGFNPKNLVLIGIDTDKRQDSSIVLGNLYGRLLERVNALPGVRTASLLWATPLTDSGWDEFVSVPGRTVISKQQSDTCINLIGPRFFDTMEIPLLAGRQFTETDTAASEKVGILNELAARRFFPGVNPIGKHIELENTAIRIIGIAGNIKYFNLRDPAPPELYLPYTQKTGKTWSLTFVIKTRSGIASIYPAFRSVLREIAPDVPTGTIETMQEQVDESLARERLMATLSVFFGILALLLTSIGLYGILAYGVVRRTAEIGVRMALGARGHDVIWLVLRETIGLVAIGTAFGVIAVLTTSRVIASLLYGIRPNDPGNLALAVLVLISVAAIAAYLPARRASRLDPMLALREE